LLYSLEFLLGEVMCGDNFGSNHQEASALGFAPGACAPGFMRAPASQAKNLF
jgi:hypothetical protein